MWELLVSSMFLILDYVIVSKCKIYAVTKHKIQKLKESIGRKDELLSEIKSKWFETTSRWNSEKEKLADELKSARIQSTELSDLIYLQLLFIV